MDHPRPAPAANPPSTDDRLSTLAIAALDADRPAATRAIADLRAAGPAGLAALLSTHAAAVDRHRADPLRSEPMWDRLSAALDAVAAQQDAWSAGLYWYTDLAAAERAAAAAHKPILSLRLLGTLDTEFSCANSRFFRTALYPNAAVGRMLRERYVLHWQTHRPVPRLTIDYGDGRVVERTITGNSAHYVLTATGRVVDVIPGLYGPAAFVRQLQASYGLARAGDGPTFDSALAQFHDRQAAATRRAWATDLAMLGATLPAPAGAAAFVLAPPAAPAQPPAAAPPAIAAARIAVSKSGIEARPILALIPDRAALAQRTTDDLWPRLAALHAADATLDTASRTVMLAKAGPDAVMANRVTCSKADVETPLARLVRTFERSLAEDTVRNEYAFHAQVHDWFAAGTAPRALDDLNERVYAELFLMPKSDPWLGLVPADAYTALPPSATVGARVDGGR